MSELLEIEEISIFIQQEAEKVNEVAIFKPLQQTRGASKPFKVNKQKNNSLAFKTQVFLFNNFPFLVHANRINEQAALTTSLAWLFQDASTLKFFLSPERKLQFFHAIQQTTPSFTLPNLELTEEQTALKLTTLAGFSQSLLQNPKDFQLQLRLIGNERRQTLLSQLLEQLEKPKLHSIMQVVTEVDKQTIAFHTQYVTYDILKLKPNGELEFNYVSNNVNTHTEQGARHQHVILDQSYQLVGSYCGPLHTPFHLLEQILCLLNIQNERVEILVEVPEDIFIQEEKILLTSLFSWTEFNYLSDQRDSIRFWDQKILKSKGKYYKLKLVLANIAMSHYPTPAEIGAKIRDVNDEALLLFVAEFFKKQNIVCEKLETLYARLQAWKHHKGDELKYEGELLVLLDEFKAIKPHLCELLLQEPSTVETITLQQMLSKRFKEMDALLSFSVVANALGYKHNKNALASDQRLLAAEAADKAAYAFRIITGYSFAPYYCTHESSMLFQVLYSLYFLWEEPQISHWLTTDRKPLKKTKYLLPWLYRQ